MVNVIIGSRRGRINNSTSLLWKFFARAIVPIGFLLLIFYSAIYVYESRKSVENEITNARNDLEHIAQIIAYPIWNFNLEQTTIILESSLDNPRIKGLRIDFLIEPVADIRRLYGASFPEQGEQILRSPITLMQADGTKQEIGMLEAIVSTDGRYRELALALARNLAVGLLLLLILSAGIAYALKRTVLSPLAEVKASLDYFKKTNQRRQVAWRSNDELAEFINEYNSSLTHAEQLENDLLQARMESENANRAKSAFLANMSHELRTPLNAILGFAQIMQQSPHLPEQHKQQAQSIYKGGQHLLTLINDILDLAKVEAGRIELFPEQVDVESFFQELVEMFRLHAEKKGIAFHYQAEAPLPDRIHIDPVRLRQVIINLLGNAVKFTEQGQLDFGVDYRDGQLHIRVTDSGPGIAPEQHEEIFKPFSQTGNKQHKLQGTGLGLSITRKIIELMNGSIELDSRLGEGSCFYVQIPVAAVFASAAAAHTEAPEQHEIIGYRRTGSPDPFRILVVDDIANNREVLRQMLEPLGFEMREADNGETCLQRAPDWQLHLVLMDLCMPGLDGLETTRKLHRLEGLENLPVIIVSASAYEEDKEIARAAGCVGYLKKPLERVLLLEALQKHLPLTWEYAQNADLPTPRTQGIALDDAQREELMSMVHSGAISNIIEYLEQLTQAPDCPSQVHELLKLAEVFNLDEIRRGLEAR